MITLSISGTAHSQAGELDTSFNHVGFVMTEVDDDPDNTAYDIVVQEDGGIVVVGGCQLYDILLTRYLPNGDLDPSFDGDGFATAHFDGMFARAYGVLVQPDGKLITVGGCNIPQGEQYLALTRHDAAGVLDPSFGTDGLVSTFVSGESEDCLFDALLLDNGKIVATGRTKDSGTIKFLLVRYLSDGQIDETFATNGIALAGAVVSSQGMAVKAQTDGKFVVGGLGYNPDIGHVCTLARFMPEGSLDTTFGEGGLVVTDLEGEEIYMRGMGIQSNGKIVLAGYGNGNSDIGLLLRYDTDGRLDTTFGVGGAVFSLLDTSSITAWSSMFIQPDDKIVAAGYASDQTAEYREFALARFLPDGQPDPSFGSDGAAVTDIGPYTSEAWCMTMQQGGKILVGGRWLQWGNDANLAVARYLNDLNVGFADTSHGEMRLVYPNPVEQMVTIRYELSRERRVELSLCDVHGRLIRSFNRQAMRPAGPNCEELDLDGITSGHYLLMLKGEGVDLAVRVTKL